MLPFSLAVAQLLAPVAAAEPAKAEVQGTVRLHGSGAPVAGARILADGLKTTSDELGRFTLELAPGPVRIEASAPGYLPLTVALDLGSGDRERVVLRLVSALEEVVVEGAPRPEELQERIVTVEELRRVPGSFGDPIRALQSLPSVSRTGDLSGELVVRGAEATNTAVYLDGMRVPYLYHLLVGRSVVDPALIEDVSFHPGAIPPRYGNVTQAVVDARIAEGPAERGVHGTAHLDPLDGGASLSANLSPSTTLRLSGRVGWAAAVASGALGAWNGVTGGSGPLPELTFPYEDHTLRLDHRRGPHVWSLSVIGAHDTLRYVPSTTPEDLEQQVIDDLGYDPYLWVDAGFFRARARWTHASGGHATSAWLIGGRDVQQNLVPLLGRLGAGGIQDARATQWNVTAGSSATAPLGERAGVEVGAEGVVQPSTYQQLDQGVSASGAPSLPAEEAAPAESIELLAAYGGPWVALPLELGREARSSLTPAFRLSMHQFGGPWVVVPEPQLASRLRLSQRVSVVGFAGMSSQGPKLAEIGAGDERALGVTRAGQTSLGVELRFPHGVSLDATAYATGMWGVVVRDTRLTLDDQPRDPLFVGMPTTTTGGAQVPTEWHGILHEEPVFRSATGQAFGGEVLLRMMPRGPQFGWISASLGRSFRTVDGPGAERTPSDADLPVAMVGVYGLGLPDRWSASVRGQLTSGLPFTPEQAVYAYVFNDPNYTEIAWFDYASVPGAPNSDRYPVYARLDLRIEKTWVRPRAEWTAYLDVFNATNRHNPLWAAYNWNYSELERTVYVPIVPALGLAVEY